jgi:carbonic anhydrase/acetyltransferase-like protein (isoleucine patch superfamily)
MGHINVIVKIINHGILNTEQHLGHQTMFPSLIQSLCTSSSRQLQHTNLFNNYQTIKRHSRYLGSFSVCKYLGSRIERGHNTFIANNATVLGAVKLGENSSIFYGCTVRADINTIEIGRNSNVQDNSVLHVSSATGVKIGDNVTIGHNCIIHACTVGNNCLVGMGTIIMDNAEIGENCIIGAGAVITKDKKFAANSLIIGSPAKKLRDVSAEEQAFITKSAEKYVLVTQEHAAYQAESSRKQ